MPRKSLNREKMKELFWRKALIRQIESGLSQSSFCKQEGLNANSFSWWKREIAVRDRAATEGPALDETPLFVPVTSVSVVSPGPQVASSAIAEIDLKASVVRIFTGIDRKTLHEIVAGLREAGS